MSRGGRGGRGGGRGGLSSAARLNSGAVPFDIDEELEKEFAKQKEDADNFFPEHFPHLAAPPTEEELKEVREYLDLCSRMKKGWLEESIRKLDKKKVERAKQAEKYNPFTDVPQYGKKNTTEKAQRFSDFPFKKEHFPKELWDVLDVSDDEGDKPDARKKKLKINTKSTRDKLAEFDEDEEAENEAENEATEKKNPDDDEVEELEDDEFDEDENDDMADDYNAERYFEDGEEDYEDGGGGGDDDGDGY